MANPRRRHSNTRSQKRRTHWKAEEPSIALCPECKEPKLTHRICPRCGFYKGRKVVVKDES